ncbi:hypothetical protein FYK55_19260 [Roseiconus nitratireducens]|uniref:Uncharacterized protein n=1 Tax=Roseiconus nitratireducens TaxID=2605748 RepID=A0A5M6D0K8_9BACT|nr:hypothetical protein [Roseiconus nitratireducens]KAA5541038.1 hypothetical protein FYK55_19260 [Roseiconus nitratireducens]
MQYPLQLRFKLLTLGQRITVNDAGDNLVMFISQKLFKLREKVEIFGDHSRSELLFRIEADRVIDFSANYHFSDAEGNVWGAVRRKGMKSLWAAHYEVMQDGQVDMTIREESPVKKLIESVLGEIPLVGLAAIYLLNPSYIVSRPDGTPLLRLTKHPAVFEGKFSLQKLAEMPEDDELRSLLALLMLVLLERGRG